MKVSSRASILTLLGVVFFVTVPVVDAFQGTTPSGCCSILPRTSIINPRTAAATRTKKRCPSSRLFELADDDKWDETPQETNDPSFLEGIKEWFRSEEGAEDIRTYTTSLVVALLLRLLVIEPRYIPSLSMYPTFEVGDQLAVEKVTKRIRPFDRNEVVVFNPPIAFRRVLEGSYATPETAQKAREALIKRIVAIEGDTVQVTKGKLYINGVKQDEPFTAEDAAYEFGPVVVPPGKLLVLGDNRNHSLDGHIWGFLPKENVIGRAVFTYWPPWRIGNEGMY